MLYLGAYTTGFRRAFKQGGLTGLKKRFYFKRSYMVVLIKILFEFTRFFNYASLQYKLEGIHTAVKRLSMREELLGDRYVRFGKATHMDGQEQCLSSASIAFLCLGQGRDPSAGTPSALDKT